MTFTNIDQFDLHQALSSLKHRPLSEKTGLFSKALQQLKEQKHCLYMRQVLSAADREVRVYDPISKSVRSMLMFGSNNYLGLANHPLVRERIKRTMRTFGCGLAGPPLLNGYTKLHRELEEQLADLKHSEDALIFSTGYGTNLGLLNALNGPNTVVLFDELSHASFHDGLKMGKSNSCSFAHNNVQELARLLEEFASQAHGDCLVGVEGVYSMDGDLAPLPEMVELCERYGAWLMVDDAHGTGVLGENGGGTAEHFGLSGRIPINMGTFSKTFAMVGGFVCADKAVIDYLRFFARSYMFSASLPPVVVAGVLAGLQVLRDEPWLRYRLHDNVHYLTEGLRALGFSINPQAAIIAIHVPDWMNIRQAALRFHELGIFLNAIEYPAVPLNQQRFRISLMASHTRQDLDRLLSAIEQVWKEQSEAANL